MQSVERMLSTDRLWGVDWSPGDASWCRLSRNLGNARILLGILECAPEFYIPACCLYVLRMYERLFGSWYESVLQNKRWKSAWKTSWQGNAWILGTKFGGIHPTIQSQKLIENLYKSPETQKREKLTDFRLKCDMNCGGIELTTKQSTTYYY